MVDVALATKAWEAALRVPTWKHSPVWIHTDIEPGNLLASSGHLSAVIDLAA
jgi:aminoglycoside phosphotransferase (APT) family kinase protein